MSTRERIARTGNWLGSETWKNTSRRRLARQARALLQRSRIQIKTISKTIKSSEFKSSPAPENPNRTSTHLCLGAALTFVLLKGGSLRWASASATP
jgi:hypothetical protein